MTPSKVKPELPPVATSVSVAVTDPSAAANDDSMPVPVPNDLRNPLWIIAIGMAWFFGIVAAVIAAS
jgi:hypothetical protein